MSDGDERFENYMNDDDDDDKDGNEGVCLLETLFNKSKFLAELMKICLEKNSTEKSFLKEIEKECLETLRQYNYIIVSEMTGDDL